MLKLFSTFQDEDRVFFLTELLQGGELWGVIYATPNGAFARKFFLCGKSRNVRGITDVADRELIQERVVVDPEL